MKNEIVYYPTAKWVSIIGNFTADELREIAKKIDNPELREDEEEDGSKE